MKTLVSLFESTLSFLLGLALGLLVVWISGESPVDVIEILVMSAFGSRYDFGMTVFYSIPLVFTGLAFGVSFRAGLFNIGAEGQLMMGSILVAVLGAKAAEVPNEIAPFLGVLAAVLGGGLYGGLAGWIRAYRGGHEVIVTIMLNFIAAGIVGFLILNVAPNPQTQNPETVPILDSFRLLPFEFFDQAPVGSALFLSLVAAGSLYVVYRYTRWGFNLDSVGKNPTAARLSGIDVKKMQFQAMILSGALAGCVGVVEVMGNRFMYQQGFSPGYGFLGIAVALLARTNPVGTILAAFLFGALQKGASDLSFETETLTSDVSLLFQGAVIAAVSATGIWSALRQRIFRREFG